MKPEQEQKLLGIFTALPEPALRRLYQAFLFGQAADPDQLPYKALIILSEKAARDRGLELAETLDQAGTEEELQSVAGALADEPVEEEGPEEEDRLAVLKRRLEKRAAEVRQSIIGPGSAPAAPLILDKTEIISPPEEMGEPVAKAAPAPLEQPAAEMQEAAADFAVAEPAISQTVPTADEKEQRVAEPAPETSAKSSAETPAETPAEKPDDILAQVRSFFGSAPDGEAEAETPATLEQVPADAPEPVAEDENLMAEEPVADPVTAGAMPSGADSGEEAVSAEGATELFFENHQPGEDQPADDADGLSKTVKSNIRGEGALVDDLAFTEGDVPPVPPTAMADDVEFVPPRNAMHAFCRPFEALIIDPPPFVSRLEGYICSTSLPAIWRLISEESAGSQIREMWMKAELGQGEKDEAFFRELTARMHEVASSQLQSLARESRENPAFRRALTARLGGAVVLSDFFEFQILLTMAEAYQRYLASALIHVQDGAIINNGAVANVILSAAEEHPALAGYLQFALLSQLDRPWEGLQLYHRLKQLSSGNLPATERQVIPEHFLSMLEGAVKGVSQQLVDNFGDAAIPVALMSVEEYATGLRQEADTLGERAVLSRLKPVFKQAGENLIRLYRRCLQDLTAALPAKTPPGTEILLPDPVWIDENPNASALLEKGNSALRFLQDTEQMARNLGAASARMKATARASEQVQTYCEQLIEEIGAQDGALRDAAKRLSEPVFDFAELLLGEGIAGKFRLKAEAASNSRAAS